MTTPTQAQIEAALWAYNKAEGQGRDERIKAALIAATEVGDKTQSTQGLVRRLVDSANMSEETDIKDLLLEAADALTAAAEARIKERLTHPSDEVITTEVEIYPQTINYEVAEVEKSELEKQYDHNADLDREIERLLRSELAAAEAGNRRQAFYDQCGTPSAGMGEPPFELQYSAKGIVRERNAIIERCAQVAEQMQGRPNQVLFSGAEIAAAIRALKDKP